MNRVAVTGRGIVCAGADNVGEFWKLLSRGESAIVPLADPGSPPYKFPVGAQALSFDPGQHFDEKSQLLLERFAQLAVVAARQAVAESGLPLTDLSDQVAVITGTSVGGQFSEEEGYRKLYRENNPRVSPLTIPRTMANAAASQISLEFGLQGPSYTVSTACSSSNHALGQAFQMIRSGMVTAAIAGGSEAVFSEGLLRAWEAMRVVAPEPCRPFSAGRRGLSLGEGGAMLVLENWDYARARGASIFAEVKGFACSADAHHITQPASVGPYKSMAWALKDAGLVPEQVGYINAHGTGTLSNDSTESEAIRLTFGAQTERVWVSSTKSTHGHTLGAAGAIEALATLLALEHQILPPTLHYLGADPMCPLNLVVEQARPAAFEYALSNTFAFGGLNATLVLARGSNGDLS